MRKMTIPKMSAAIHGPISQRYFFILRLLLEMDSVTCPHILYHFSGVVSGTARGNLDLSSFRYIC